MLGGHIQGTQCLSVKRALRIEAQSTRPLPAILWKLPLPPSHQTALKGNSQDSLGNVGGGDQRCLGSSLDGSHFHLGQ